ncbi:MAG: glycoside hydrolase family 2 protein, partial [Firmicutes bacterium]|nr:glycoside hydrolase family 2 protein [Candidatus Colimorpha enterica]
MNKISLGGIWRLTGGGYDCEGSVPGSVYSFLLGAGLIDDPFYRDNELKALEIMDNEFTFSRTFGYKKKGCPVLLRCEGLDTLCALYLNGEKIADTDNMHRTYEIDVTGLLRDGENEIKAVFSPVDPYIKAKQEERFSFGPWMAMKGFAHIRKAECMMGWDWGPRLPDAGIWREISLLEKDSSRITEFHPVQRHEGGRVFITPNVLSDGGEAKVILTSPDGRKTYLTPNAENEINDPELWWPNGLGAQPIYTLRAELYDGDTLADVSEKKIGLRTLKLVREKDKWGECFCHEVNGVRFFAMGADYIPEDNVFSRITPERSRTLLTQCRDSHFNAIRIWGGGYYPDDWFFDLCDELGIVLFFDIMFACTSP